MSSNSSIDSIKDHISKAQDQYPRIESAISQLSERIQKCETEISDIEGNISQVTSDANKLKQKLSSDLSSLDFYSSRHKEISRNKENADRYSDSLAQLEFQIETYKTKIRSEESELSEKQNELKCLNQTLSTKQQEIADFTQKLSDRRRSCGNLANALMTHARILDNQTKIMQNQQRGFSSVSSIRFAEQAGGSAAQSRGDKVSSNIASTITAAKLAQRYAKLAQANVSNSAETPGSDSAPVNQTNKAKSYSSRTSNQQSNNGIRNFIQKHSDSILVGMTAFSMIAGAGYHASRPDETFKEPGKEKSQMEIIAERNAEVDNALTGPDDLISHMEWKQDTEEYFSAISASNVSISGPPHPQKKKIHHI